MKYVNNTKLAVDVNDKKKTNSRKKNNSLLFLIKIPAQVVFFIETMEYNDLSGI